MPAIANNQTGETIAVRDTPQLLHGTWECGDQRFADPDGTGYTPVLALEPLTPMTLYMAFTPTERIAIKTSQDPYVKEFWEMYQLSVQLQKPTDPNLVSVQGALAYLARPATAEPPGAGILASEDRIQQILQGIPQ